MLFLAHKISHFWKNVSAFYQDEASQHPEVEGTTEQPKQNT
jgi:hypothetical protein